MLDQVEGCVKRVIFDLDGTLIDALADIHAITNRILLAEGREPLPRATVQSFVGRGAPNLVARVIEATRLDPADHTRLLAAFVADYETATSLTHPYPGVPEMLDALESTDLDLAICTNKPAAPTRAVIAAMGWAGRFDPVISGDTLPVKKPDPAPLQRAAAPVRLEDCLYVGDSEVDAETALAAGVCFALFTGGFRKSPVSEIPHDYAFSDFMNLAEYAAMQTTEKQI